MTPEERDAFLKRWSKGQTIYTNEWKLWFAWYPVRLLTLEWAWFRYVAYRLTTGNLGVIGGYDYCWPEGANLMKWPKWTEPPIEIRPVSYMDWKPRDNDLSEDEHKALKDGMMTRWNDGWDKDDWEDLQDMVAPVVGMIVLGGIAFLIWKFGYLLS